MTEPKFQDRVALFGSASSLPGKHGISFIGPFGSRVSFASQQARAFNTVWAWSEERDHRSGADVAVIGGGIAGLTTSAILAAKRHTVTLFESHPQLVKHQKNARHRFVHPTVNFWPHQNLVPTTSQPYLDWYETTSNCAATAIENEWRSHFENRLHQLKTNRTVVGVKRVKDKMRVSYTVTGQPDRDVGVFDHVFVATGFGEETKVWSGDKSYWEPDDLDGLVASGSRQFVVAGTGDGGLIDTFRLIQKNFNGGGICFDLIAEMEKTGLRGLVEQIERDAKNQKTVAAAAKSYASAYGDLVTRKLTSGTRKMLQDRVAMDLELVGTIPHPFAINAAPVHKIMLAAALADNVIRYTCGRLVKDSVSERPMIQTKTAVHEVPASAIVVTRIGPSGSLRWLLKDAEIAKLREAQSHLADILRPADLPMEFFEACDGAPQRDTQDQNFIEFRKLLATDYLWAKFQARCDTSGFNDKKGYRVIYAPDTVDKNKLPSDLFGIACFPHPEHDGEWV